jgi:hypothetical protein
MAANKKSHKGRGQSNKSGGAMMSLRSGFKSAVGQGKKGHKKAKKWTFTEVFFYIFLAALVLVLIWQLK